MNQRERWLNVWNFHPVDRLPHEEFGYWTETLARWHNEGLPREIDSDWKADRHFGFDDRRGIPVNFGLVPGFEYKVLEERGDRRLIRDGNGATCEVPVSGASTIPNFLRYGIVDRADWPAFKEKLDPDNPDRYPKPEDWAKQKAAFENSEIPVGLYLGPGFYGGLRDWIGVERLSEMLYEEPDLVHEMMETLCECMYRTAENAIVRLGVRPDFASIWEDMAYNAGPLISPRQFSEFMVPRYKRVTDLLKKHGCNLTIVDCDGNIDALVPLWLKAGVNIMFPIEARAGSDPYNYRKKYGKDVLLLGGVDKIQLIRGKAAIDGELKRLEPLMREGGFIPHVDHRVPPDVSYENYLYYLEQKKKYLGFK